MGDRGKSLNLIFSSVAKHDLSTRINKPVQGIIFPLQSLGFINYKIVLFLIIRKNILILLEYGKRKYSVPERYRTLKRVVLFFLRLKVAFAVGNTTNQQTVPLLGTVIFHTINKLV